MSELNPKHIPTCTCAKCRTYRLSHCALPTSILNAGLFAVPQLGTKLADLTDINRVKLSEKVPNGALIVSIRNVSLHGMLLHSEPASKLLGAQETIELPVGDLETYLISADSENCSVVVSYTRLMDA